MSAVTFLVDPSMCDGQNALPRDVYGQLDTVVRTDLHYHYSTPVCAHRWLAVCDDDAYGHGALLARLERALPSLISALRADRGESVPMSLVSLGPGDGALDELMLRALDATLDVEEYLGLDYSFELLRRSTHRLTHARGLAPAVSDPGDLRRFPWRALLVARGRRHTRRTPVLADRLYARQLRGRCAAQADRTVDARR